MTPKTPNQLGKRGMCRSVCKPLEMIATVSSVATTGCSAQYAST